MNMEVTAPFKQEDLCKELRIDIDESPEFKSVPGGVISEDVVQLRRSIGEPEIIESGLRSNAENPHLPHNHERNEVVFTGTHDNDTEMTTAFKQEDLVKHFLSDIDKSPEIKFVASQCCIYKVPIAIRSVNEKLYTPKLISVGPLHHDKPELANMEKKKKQYVKSFLLRTTTMKIDKILSFIKDNEQKIRACYAEASPLKSCEFVMMILYDSIFIIEIFLRDKSHDKSDILLVTRPISLTLRTDLQLFENQLPYFILEDIYKLAFHGTDVPTFKELSVDFFAAYMDIGLTHSTPELGVKHFIDWRRISLLKSYSRSMSDEKIVHDLPCAVKLQESGIKFTGVCTEEERSFLDIKFEKRKQLIPFFEVHELQIPQLNIFHETEQRLRNIMALEQCVYPDNALVCDYIQLMDFLINTVEDVDLLVGNQIIFNHMGDNVSAANMFNRLCSNVIISPSSYHNLCKQLKEHYRNPWNRARATLKRVYFNNPWRGTATVAAVILLLLTVAQTVFSILQVV